MHTNKLLFFVVLSLITGFIWGTAFHIDRLHPLRQYDRMITIDIIRKGDDIWIVNHKTGQLMFEYKRFKDADKVIFREYEDILK